MHGCETPRETPRQIGPYSLSRCPNWILSTPDGFRDATIAAYKDYEAGVVQDWPDGWAGAIVAGVRFIQSNAADSHAERTRKQRRRQQSDQRRRQASGGGY